MPFESSAVSWRLSVVTGPNGTVMPCGRSAFGLACSIAPWVQTPFASTELSNTPGRKGDPMGLGIGISPSFTTAGKPKYVT